MGAPKGNQFWKLRSKHGRDKLFSTPELLWEAACEYFQWCDDNPLKEEKAFHFQGKIVKDQTNKLRAYTLHGLCLYLDCSTQFFRNFQQNNKDAKDFMAVITRIKETIYNQKFQGASADLLNANIIARDLGLADKVDKTTREIPMDKESIERELKKIEEEILAERGDNG